jgi:small-conductance mechanosensitive channel
MNELFYRDVVGTPLYRWLLSVGTLLVTVSLISLAKTLIAKHERRGVLALQLIKDTRFFLIIALGVHSALAFITLPAAVESGWQKVFVCLIVIQCGLWARTLTEYCIHFYLAKRTHDPSSTAAINLIGFLARVFIYALLVLLALRHFGVDITALVAGVGVGGVAVALAVQNILGDLFASLSIIIDQPFVVGDAITVDDLSGTIERIGLKTTRVRGITGEELVFSNADLLKSRIHNFKRMSERRVLFRVTVDSATPPEKLELVPKIIHSLIDPIEKTRFDRCVLSQITDVGFVFETVYWVQDPQYSVFVNIHHAVLLAVYRKFQEAHISLSSSNRNFILKGDANP